MSFVEKQELTEKKNFSERFNALKKTNLHLALNNLKEFWSTTQYARKSVKSEKLTQY